MKKLTFSLFLVAIATISMFASNTQVDGIWYDFNSSTKTASVTYRGYDYGAYSNEYSGSVVIPETVTYNSTTYSVTSIGDYAFYGCRGLTSVTIPNSVTTIGGEAFAYCSGLTSVTIPNSVTTIGRSAFSDCTGLTSITIPNSVTTIGKYAFDDCYGLTSVTIGNSVTTIGAQAFGFCTGLTKTNFTGTIAEWCKIEFFDSNSNPICHSHNLFMHDKEVKDLIIPEGVNAIGDYAFYNCFGLTSITIPNSVTTIGYKAFYSCSGLTSVTIPNSVTKIGSSVFYGCTSLTSVIWNAKNYEPFFDDFSRRPISPFYDVRAQITSFAFGNEVETIPGSLCQGMSKLTSVTIPNSVTTIGERAFNGCTGLASVTIPNSVTTIGEYAFSGCTGLTSITIPNSVTTIGERAFYNVNNIVYNGIATGSPWGAKSVNGYVDGYLVYSDASKTTLCGCSSAATGEITIPNSVTTIGDYAFFNCSSLTSVTIPNSVIEIGYGAFSGCSGLTSIAIPNSVTTIEDDTFRGCSGLTSVTIPNSVIEIGYGAFSGCSGLTSIAIPNSVTTIEDDTFRGCNGLTSVSIGNSVATIGSSAFRGCSGLTSITCYAQNPPICGSYCFSDVPKDIPLYIPYDASLSAYQSAEGWKDFTNIITMYFDVCGEDLRWKYKDGTLSISGTGDMFDFTQTDSPWLDLKDSVTNVVFPSNITSIGNYAFYGFSKLTSVTTPNAVTEIGGSAFSGCIGLSSVTIGNSVTTIGESAFEDCTYLKTITLGKSLTDIGCNAFKGDFRIEEITSYAEVTPNVCSSTFDGLSKQYIYLYVPENSIRGYQVDPNWNGFDIRTKSADKKPIDGDNPIVTPTDQDVTITWPITDGTDTYTLTITKGGETVCVLTFNGNGQLTNIAFAAPGHNEPRQAPAATLTAQGYQFTVTGLNPGTAYNYSVTATDAGGKTLAEHKGNFSTTGGTGLESVHDARCTMHKVLRNGQLLIETHNATYTPLGQKVK